MKQLLAVAALVAALPAAAGPFAGTAALADADLATMRGGIELPGGVVAQIGVAIETRVDGQLALRTQFSTESPGVQLFSVGPAAGGAGATGGGAMPAVQIARNGAGTTLTVIPAAPINIRVGSPADAAPARAALPVVAGGPGVAVALGTVTLQEGPAGIVARLSGVDIDITHLVGQATASIVGNSGNDRVIDTATVIDVQLSGGLLPGDLAARLGALAGLLR